MRRLVLIAALALASASAEAGGTRGLSTVTTNDSPAATDSHKAGVLSAQAADSRSLSTGAATNDVTATPHAPPKPGALTAQTGGTVTTPPAPPPQAVETPRYAPPPGVETPRYAPPPAEAAKPVVDTTRNTESPAQMQVQPAAQPPVQTPAETQPPRYTARPPIDDESVAATAPSARQHMPSREARYRHGRSHHAGYYRSDWSGYGWGYGRPHFRPHHWSAWRIIGALHRYGFYW